MPKQYKYKQQADIISQRLGTIASETNAKVKALVIKKILQDADVGASEWYKKKIGDLTSFQSEVYKIVNEGNKNLKKELKTTYIEELLTLPQRKSLVNELDEGAAKLYKVSVDFYRQLTSRIMAESNSTTKTLQEIISFNAKGITNVGVVEYSDNSKRSYEAYIEMKTRTDIHQDIGNNLLKSGEDAGIIFYMCSYFGDCAADHADYQGRIYADKYWREIAPSEKHEEIEKYINENDILYMQDVMDNEPWLTTRPNCRHFFQAISIDTALKLTSEESKNEQREKMGMNANGKYDPDNYKALQEQRANERQIRAYKEQKIAQTEIYKAAIRNGDKKAEIEALSNIKHANQQLYGYTDKDGNKHPGYFAEQRMLIEKYPALQRNHMREQVDFFTNGNK